MQAILMTRLDEAQKTPDLLTRHDALPAARRARRFTGSRTVKRNVWGEGTARRGRPVALADPQLLTISRVIFITIRNV